MTIREHRGHRQKGERVDLGEEKGRKGDEGKRTGERY
jgi:hypothetical protein